MGGLQTKQTINIIYTDDLFHILIHFKKLYEEMNKNHEQDVAGRIRDNQSRYDIQAMPFYPQRTYTQTNITEI